MKKHIATIILIILATVFLVACRNSGDNNDDGGGTKRPVAPSRDDSIIDTYIYRSHHLLLEKLPETASGVFVDENRIVYWYSDSTPQIMVQSINPNIEPAMSMRVARIPTVGWRISVGGLHITEDGYLELVTVEDFDDGTVAVSHVIYDNDGKEIVINDLTDMIKPFDGFVHIEQIVFTDENNIVIVTRGTPEKDVYLIDSEGELLGQLKMHPRERIAKLRDGRVVISQHEGWTVVSETTNLRVIDFENAERDETIPVPVQDAHRLIPAGANQLYDILLSDNRYVYGFNIESNTLTPLLDWMETGVISTYDNHIAVLPDDRIIVIDTEFVPTGSDNEWYTDFYLLTRISRSELPEKTILTLDGWYYCETIAAEVIKFNRENEHYHIEIARHPPDEDSQSRMHRLRVEIIAGRGPDILFESHNFMVGSVAYTDLYTFIDADPELNRSDFFPSVLNLFETTEGELPYIPRKFIVGSNVALRETAERIGPLTYTNLLRTLDEPGVNRITSHDNFIIGSSVIDFPAFIDLKANQAHFDSDEFINWLEMTARLPVYDSWDDYDEKREHIMPGDITKRFLDGEQLLSGLHLDTPDEFRLHRMVLGDVVAVGNPTWSGGQHQVLFWERFGISASSQHKDVAWEFIRRFLLPDAPEFRARGLPSRIDKYDKLVAELMTPLMSDGVEIPREVYYDGLIIDVYPMTEEDAALTREIIDNVSYAFGDADEIIVQIFNEVTPPFFRGTQSAADTARILQNRIQRILDERG